MEWLNYHHLQYFWVTARAGTIRAAASKLNVSQPSISAQISALESAVGEKLFQRAGRGRSLTETGELVLGYADEIFALGQELMNSLKGAEGGRVLRLNVGVVDSFPKLMTNQILKPVFEMPETVHVLCREGKLDDLLAQLVVHRLDMVLSDEPASKNLSVRTFDHILGTSTVSICAVPSLANRLRRNFPESLNDAPAVLPSSNTALRTRLEIWLDSVGVRPRVVAECEDLALMKTLAADGRGFIALPTEAMKDASGHYGFMSVGQAGKFKESFYAITAERRITHPAISLLTNKSGQKRK